MWLANPCLATPFIQASKSYIVIKDFREYKSYLIDMIISTIKNISAKDFIKLFKYKNLVIDLTVN